MSGKCKSLSGCYSPVLKTIIANVQLFFAEKIACHQNDGYYLF